jgi:dienelactone hydrolase
MTTVLLFHHAQGQTQGFLAFADRLREAGHTVHTPDLFDGATFATVEEGVAHARETGFEEILRRGIASAEGVATDVVYAGFSLGGMPAQALVQTREGARGALLFHACVPPGEFGDAWPEGMPAQIHFMEDDPWAEEDLPAARELSSAVDEVELFLYPGAGHLFAEAGSPDYDEAAAVLLTQRSLEFLRRVG